MVLVAIKVWEDRDLDLISGFQPNEDIAVFFLMDPNGGRSGVELPNPYFRAFELQTTRVWGVPTGRIVKHDLIYHSTFARKTQ